MYELTLNNEIDFEPEEWLGNYVEGFTMESEETYRLKVTATFDMEYYPETYETPSEMEINPTELEINGKPAKWDVLTDREFDFLLDQAAREYHNEY